jgi:hypothetical protein
MIELEQAILDLHAQFTRAAALAVKHCPVDHQDRTEVAELYTSAAIDKLINNLIFLDNGDD